MKFNRNKWWGKRGRFRRQMMVLYGRVREFSKPYMSAVMGQVKALYRKAQRSENSILDRINIFIPIALTALIVLGMAIPWYGYNAANIRNWIFLLAGVWGFYGIIIAGRRTAEFAKQVHIQKQGQVADSLAKAAEQLSSKIISVRILAILSLEKIAIEAEDEIRQDVVKVLCAYVRENRPIGQEDTKSANSKSPMPGDIMEVIYVLSGMKNSKQADFIMDLSKINLSGVNLSGINLSGADLSGAYLSDANLRRTNLSGANLSGADLRHANLSGTDLSGTDLSDADLSGASLSEISFLVPEAVPGESVVADLSGANLLNAKLDDVRWLENVMDLESIQNPPEEIKEEIERQANDYW